MYDIILQCQTCGKVKKFGEWVEVTEGLRELIKDLRVIYILCPRCEGIAVPSSPKEPAILRYEGY